MEERDEIATRGHGADSTAAGCFLRLFWMAGGNLLLVTLALSIAHQPTWTLSARDLGYALSLAAVLTARGIEVRHLGGMGADGQPVTRRGLRRFALTQAAVATAGWIAAQSLHI